MIRRLTLGTPIAIVLALTAGALAACGAPSAQHGTMSLVQVPADAPTLQSAADRVAPGGMILISPGHYDETMIVTTPDVTVRGMDRNTVIIDGGGIRPYGVVGIADGIRIENLTVQRTTFYGALVTGLHDSSGPRANADNGSYETFDTKKFPPLRRFQIDHVTAVDNGLYGIYAFNSQHGVISDNYASGSADSGIYVGQCHACDIVVTRNVAERNAVGFENANASTPVSITANRFSDNRVGMTFLSDYQEVFIPEAGDVIAGNLIADNNNPRTPEQADGGFGIGIGISGGTENQFVNNRIVNNRRSGVVISNNTDLASKANSFRGNQYAGNRVDFADVSATATPGVGNCPDTTSVVPPVASPCTASSTGRSIAAGVLLGYLTAPAGISFLTVPAPAAQPSMTAPAVPPTSTLPTSLEIRDVGAIPVPPPSLFEALTWKG